jgi:hypothetical protein
MPQTIIPFKRDSKAFVIAIFVIMVAVRLLYWVLGAVARWPLWWKRITAWVKTMQFDEMSLVSALRRGRDDTDGNVEELELDPLTV